MQADERALAYSIARGQGLSAIDAMRWSHCEWSRGEYRYLCDLLAWYLAPVTMARIELDGKCAYAGWKKDGG